MNKVILFAGVISLCAGGAAFAKDDDEEMIDDLTAIPEMSMAVSDVSVPKVMTEKTPAWTPKQGDKYDFKAHPFPTEPAGPDGKVPSHAPVTVGKHSWLDVLGGSAKADQAHTTCNSYLYGRADGSHYWNIYCYNYNAYETSYSGSQTVYGSDTQGRAWTKTAFGTNGVAESIPYGADQTCTFAIFPNVP
jgi:hypothetical protein